MEISASSLLLYLLLAFLAGALLTFGVAVVFLAAGFRLARGRNPNVILGQQNGQIRAIGGDQPPQRGRVAPAGGNQTQGAPPGGPRL
jgi:hypothetical protein